MVKNSLVVRVTTVFIKSEVFISFVFWIYHVNLRNLKNVLKLLNFTLHLATPLSDFPPEGTFYIFLKIYMHDIIQAKIVIFSQFPFNRLTY